MSTQLEELRKEADDLGIRYGKTVGADKLAEKIEAFYESQETSGQALAEAVKEQEAPAAAEAPIINTKPSKMVVTPEQRHAIMRKTREKAAKATQIVTIVDNDQRVNNQTTTCTSTCTNAYFDLGTVTLPLNERIEVATGHINTLKEVRIPMHVKDPKTGLSAVRMRPRYAIS